MKKIVVVYSGGMDSFTLLHQMQERGLEVAALSFNYGQRHSKELEYAAAECSRLGIEHKVVDVTTINQLLQGSSLTSDVDVPEGHYAAESMKVTVVPNRNMIMLSLAIGWAISIKADAVAFGAHGGDHDIYPDCRPEFVHAMQKVADLCDWHKVRVLAPFLYADKGTIAKIGKDLGLDYGRSWTCYNGRVKACGKCGACQERIEAMAFAGINDPMEYES